MDHLHRDDEVKDGWDWIIGYERSWMECWTRRIIVWALALAWFSAYAYGLLYVLPWIFEVTVRTP